jgi:hypothetical protein
VRRVWSGGGFFEREVSEQGAGGRGCETSCGVVSNSCGDTAYATTYAGFFRGDFRA